MSIDKKYLLYNKNIYKNPNLDEIAVERRKQFSLGLFGCFRIQIRFLFSYDAFYYVKNDYDRYDSQKSQ